MCSSCNDLLAAIDGYIAKADKDLSRELGKKGYAMPRETLEYAEDIEGRTFAYPA